MFLQGKIQSNRFSEKRSSVCLSLQPGLIALADNGNIGPLARTVKRKNARRANYFSASSPSQKYVGRRRGAAIGRTTISQP
jgi:hypothetical protein